MHFLKLIVLEMAKFGSADLSILVVNLSFLQSGQLTFFVGSCEGEFLPVFVSVTNI